MLFLSRAVVVGLALATYCMTSVAAERKENSHIDHESSVDLATVNGFRSATFGMSEKEVRKAIKNDFGDEQPKFETTIERTKTLTIFSKNVLDGAPLAKVAYIFGMATEKLIHVNVVWGGEPGGADLPSLASAANLLRKYFLRQTYQRDSLVIDQNIGNGMLLFKGADAKGSEVRLEIFFIPKKDGEKNLAPEKGTLRLSYAEHPNNPDIFKIKEGSF